MLPFLYLTALVVIIYLFLNRKYSYWEKQNVPFGKPTFLVGNIGSAIILRTSIASLCKSLYSDFKGVSYVGFFNMWRPAVLVRDPEIIKTILVKDFQKYRNWVEVENHVDPAMSLNPFVLYGPKWKSVRSVLTPQFTSAKLKTMVSNIQLVSEKMVDYIKSEMRTSKRLEARQLATRFTGDSVMISAFGLDGKSFQENVPDSSKIAEQICSKSKMVQFKQTMAVLSPLMSRIMKATFLGDPVPELFKNIIQDCLKYREQNKIVRKDYLGYLAEAKEKMIPYFTTDDNLVSHAFTFFLDGFETSAITFSYALFELSQNEEIQNKARAEISTVLNRHDQKISYEVLQELEYLECIINETLRKYPVIKLMARVCLEDIIFPNPNSINDSNTVVIKKGTELFFTAEGLHNDDEYYPNPDVFDPDRFIEENKNTRPKYTFLGFGDGPKICLGRMFALTQIKLALIAILSEFDLVIDEETDIPLKQENLHIFMSPQSEILVKFVSRS